MNLLTPLPVTNNHLCVFSEKSVKLIVFLEKGITVKFDYLDFISLLFTFQR